MGDWRVWGLATFILVATFFSGFKIGSNYAKDKITKVEKVYVPQPINEDSLKAVIRSEMTPDVIRDTTLIEYIPDSTLQLLTSLQIEKEQWRKLCFDYYANKLATAKRSYGDADVKVTYYFPPKNYFEFDYTPKKQEVGFKIVYVKVKSQQPFWANKWFYFSMGQTFINSYALYRAFK